MVHAMARPRRFESAAQLPDSIPSRDAGRPKKRRRYRAHEISPDKDARDSPIDAFRPAIALFLLAFLE
jgi:hypothetical protein